MFKLLIKAALKKSKARVAGGSLEGQLAELAKCGIRLRRGITVADLLRDNERVDLERDAIHLLTIVGNGREAEPFDPFCDALRHFDSECIEDHGDYACVAEMMRDLAGDVLPITDIDDYVDVEAGEARLSFVLYGDRFDWEAEVKDDWADPTIFSRFADLLDAQHRDVHYTFLPLGQDCLIGCCTAEELKRLNRTTGLHFVWLT